jgi:hypothetical protein
MLNSPQAQATPTADSVCDTLAVGTVKMLYKSTLTFGNHTPLGSPHKDFPLVGNRLKNQIFTEHLFSYHLTS